MGDQPDSKNTMQEDKTEILKEKNQFRLFSQNHTGLC